MANSSGRPQRLFARAYRQIRFEAKVLFGRYPRLYLQLAHRRARGEPVRADTGFVIEGFPRSGNTFATAAFGVALDTITTNRPVVAHHLHSPAQVIAAARRRIPALVLIRRPEDAVLSLVIQQPHLSLGQAFRGYMRFYKPLLPHRDDFVLATFDDVIDDFGSVTKRVNRRFGTDFPIFANTEENVRLALYRIELENRMRWGGGLEVELKGAFPSAMRTQLKETLRAKAVSSTMERMRLRAEAVYDDLTGLRR